MDGVLLLGGPTASGKTEAAIAIARTFDAEIVGADSRQIYRDMPIGTAAPSAEQLATVRHHLVGVLDPYVRYSAARFTIDAMAAVDEIRARGKRVIVAGGTGFYLRALAGGAVLSAAYDASVRERLAREAMLHPPDVLHGWLAALAPERARALHPADRYRIVRALEVHLAAGRADDRTGDLPTLRARGIPFAYVFLHVPLDDIDARIGRRVGAMLAAGFVEEAERIGVRAAASSAVGYPLAIGWTRGWANDRELRDGLARETRRYARRQRTWFRGEPLARAAIPDELEQIARETFERR